MPVRALRPTDILFQFVGAFRGQNPINARKGITTQEDVFAHLKEEYVRILLMPVRALRQDGRTGG